MKRRFNWSIWLGFVFVLVGLLTYPFFVQFPITRDFPWANLLILGAGVVILGIGLMRAFRQREIYGGRIVGSILGVLSLFVAGFFAFAAFYIVRQLPASNGAPQLGQKAPEFTLPDQDGKPVALAGLASANRAVLLIFYRGHW
jgi:drug/metabolite transporter (DMT)-like permease